MVPFVVIFVSKNEHMAPSVEDADVDLGADGNHEVGSSDEQNFQPAASHA